MGTEISSGHSQVTSPDYSKTTLNANLPPFLGASNHRYSTRHAHQAQPTASVWNRGHRTASGFCAHSLSLEWQWPECDENGHLAKKCSQLDCPMPRNPTLTPRAIFCMLEPPLFHTYVVCSSARHHPLLVLVTVMSATPAQIIHNFHRVSSCKDKWNFDILSQILESKSVFFDHVTRRKIRNLFFDFVQKRKQKIQGKLDIRYPFTRNSILRQAL